MITTSAEERIPHHYLAASTKTMHLSETITIPNDDMYYLEQPKLTRVVQPDGTAVITVSVDVHLKESKPA